MEKELRFREEHLHGPQVEKERWFVQDHTATDHDKHNRRSSEVPVTMRYRLAAQLRTTALTEQEGHKFFLMLWHDLAENSEIELDFTDWGRYETAFFSSCCHELVRHFQVSFLKDHIHFVNLSTEGQRRVGDTVAQEMQQ